MMITTSHNSQLENSRLYFQLLLIYTVIITHRRRQATYVQYKRWFEEYQKHLHLITSRRRAGLSKDIRAPFCMWFCVASEAAAFSKASKSHWNFLLFLQLLRVCFILSFRCWRVRPFSVCKWMRFIPGKRKKNVGNRIEENRVGCTGHVRVFFPFFFFWKNIFTHRR